ncbi:MAG: TonB-dependent receptor [Bacteroidales bacterium]|nr:TonB-dependent receptor [Bacteroidales bacterium]
MSFNLFLTAGLLIASLADSLDAVVISAEKGVTVSQQDTVLSENSISLSEALLRNTSLQVSDNGGPGGLKTVSLRGLGSAHTAIYIDGIRAGNVQSGQNDLGMFDISSSCIVVDYAQNSISINTARPHFDRLPVTGNFNISGGSFGTWLPTARLDFRLSENVSLSANASGVFSKGDFPYGAGLKRTNNDLNQIRSGLDLFGLMNLGDYHVKACFNGSRRGTPGSTAWPSDDRQEDRNVFVQGSVKMRFSDLYTLRTSAKGSVDNIFYTSSWGDSRYRQTEVQLNTVHDFKIKDWWRLSLAADTHWDGLNSTYYEMNRVSILTALASAFKVRRFAADLALEYNLALDKGYQHKDALSPSMNLRFNIMEGFEISALGRRMYRIPTFNELYYTGYGNPELNPEDAWTSGIGASFQRKISKRWRINADLNGFYTYLRNKITSVPTEADPNIWMPVNIGRVRSTGFDSKAAVGYRHKDFRAGLTAAYSFLSSVDCTEGSSTFGQQVPFTTRHSVSLAGDLIWKGWGLNAIFNSRSGYTGSSGPLPDWSTLDLTISKEINTDIYGSLKLKFQIRNITDCRYELVSGYPMPGRSIMGGIEYKF